MKFNFKRAQLKDRGDWYIVPSIILPTDYHWFFIKDFRSWFEKVLK